MTTNNESVSDAEIDLLLSQLVRKEAFCRYDISNQLLRELASWHLSETKTLREQVENITNTHQTLLVALDYNRKERDQLTLKLEQSQADNVRLQERVEGMLSMLRAFRYSMDSNLPFPSRDKLDEIISTTPTTALGERYRRMEAVESAAKILVARMMEIYNDPLYRYIWESASNHGIDYSNGPKWENEFIALEQALATENDKVV